MTISVSTKIDGTLVTTIEHEGMHLNYSQSPMWIVVEFNDDHTGFKAIRRDCTMNELQDLIYLFQQGVDIAKLSSLCLYQCQD
jgi:hypothetical protein